MVKAIFKTVMLLVLLAASAFATQVQVAAIQIPQAQITNLPAEVTGTANVSNGSASITLVTNFRTSWINQSGFIINLPAGDFYVSSVASGGVITLSVPYTGATANGVAFRVYSFIYLRFYASMPYTPLGASYIVQAGAPGSAQFFLQKAVTVKQGQAWLPEMTLDATMDAVNPAEQAARLSAFFYRVDGSLIAPYSGFESFFLRPDTPTSWTAIRAANQAGTVSPPDNRYYLATQIDSFLPSCTSGQMAFYQGTGRVLTCLNVGANLSITSATLNATGGGGGGSSIWSDLANPVANLNLTHSGFTTNMQWSANTGAGNLFTLQTGSNDVGTNYLFQLSTPGGGNAKTPLRVSARGADSLIVGPSGKVGFNQMIPVAQVDVVPDSTGTVSVKVSAPAGYGADLLQTQVNGILGPRLLATTGGRVDSVFGSAGADLTPGTAGGYIHIPAITTTPSGVPNTYTGSVPFTFDRAANKLYAYDGGWVDLTAGGGGGGSTAWSALTDPAGVLSLSMAANTTVFNWDSATGVNDLFRITNSSGDTGTGSLLRVQAFGSKQPFLVQDESNNILRVNSSGRVVIGPATDVQLPPVADFPALYVTGESAPSNGNMVLYQANPAPTGGYPHLRLVRAQGTLALPTTPAAGTYLGEISFNAFGTLPIVSMLAQMQSGNADLLIGHLNPAFDWFTLKGTGLIGVRTAIPAGQLHVTANASGVIPLIAESPASPTVDIFQWRVNGATKGRFVPNSTGSVYNYVFGDQALVNTATDGFVYIPTIATNAPTGTPTTFTGLAPLVLRNETGNTKLYAYLQSNWVDLTGGGGGSSVWSALTNPVANTTLSHAAFTTSMTFGATTSTNNLWTFTTGSNDTGTNYLVSVETPGTTNAKSPFRVQANGAESLVVSAGGLTSFGTATPAGLVTVVRSVTTSATNGSAANVTTAVSGTTDISGGGTVYGFRAHLTDAQTGAGARGTGGPLLAAYVRSASTDATVGAVTGITATFAINETASDAVTGILVGGPVVDSGKSLTDWVALSITAPSGSGTTTNRTAISIAANAGSSGFGIAPTAGMVHILSDAAAKRGLFVNTASSPSADNSTFANDGTNWIRFVPGSGLDTASAAVKTLNSVFGAVALNEDTQNGFIYIPTVDAVPTAVPTSFTGTAAMAFDTANNRLYVYDAGWVNVSGSGGGGSSVWSDLTAPAGNLSLAHAAFSTTMTWNSNSGSATMWTFTNTSNDTGTNYLVSIATPGALNMKSPFRIQAKGQDTMIVDAEGEVAFGSTTTTGFVNMVRSVSASGATNKPTVRIPTSVTGVDVALGVENVDSLYASITEQRTGGASAGGFPNASHFVVTKDAGTEPLLQNYTNILIDQAFNESVTNGSNAKVYGIYFVSPTVATTKTVDHWYGIYMESFPTAGTITNKYAMLILPGAGNVVIGASATTAAQLVTRAQISTQVGLRVDTASSAPISDLVQFRIDGTSIVRFVPSGSGSVVNSVFGNAALSATATDGFVYLPTTADMPTGVPTAFTGQSALVIENDTINSQYNLYGYVNGSWRNLTGTGGGGTSWSAITNPSGNLSLAHAANTTSMTWNNNSGSANMWTFTNTSGNTGHSGYLVSIETPGASNATSPFRARVRGSDAFVITAEGMVTIDPPGSVSTVLDIIESSGAGYALEARHTASGSADTVRVVNTVGSPFNFTAGSIFTQIESTGTAANGIGVSADFAVEVSDGSIPAIGSHEFVWEDASASTRRASYRIKTGTGDGVSGDRVILAPRHTITDNTATEFMRFTLSTGEIIGGEIAITVSAVSGSDRQVWTGTVYYRSLNSSGTITAPATTLANAASLTSSGTITCTFDGTTSGSTIGIIRASCDSSLGSPSLSIYASIRNNAAEAITVSP